MFETNTETLIAKKKKRTKDANCQVKGLQSLKIINTSTNRYILTSKANRIQCSLAKNSVSDRQSAISGLEIRLHRYLFINLFIYFTGAE